MACAKRSARSIRPQCAPPTSGYAAERDALLVADAPGPRPSGGVGGTRLGVKCLHAHVAWWLAGGDDPVGAWTAAELGLVRP